MIAPTKEPIHEIEEVTRVVTFPTIVATVTAVVVCTQHLLFYINDRLEKTYHHKQKRSADKVAHRLRHEKVRQLGKKPDAEVFHLRHRTAPPKRKRQNIMSAKSTKDAIHT